SVLRAMLLDIGGEFGLADVEQRPTALVERPFDVVAAQGILYHLYDQRAFLRSLHLMTRRLLIVDTQLNGRGDELLTLRREYPLNPRYSHVSGIALTPSLPALVALLDEAGFRAPRVIPFPGVVRNRWGRVVDR